MKRDIILVFLLLGGISLHAETVDQHISIVNMSAVEPSIVEIIRVHAEKELYVPVIATNVQSSCMGDLTMTGKMMALELKRPSDACLIVLANPKLADSEHAVILTNIQVAVINVSALKSGSSLDFEWRLRRLTMRGVAILFGLGSVPDPHCVMHSYRTLEELDKMGTNFSPPLGDQFRNAAAARGLSVRPLFTPRPNLKKPAVKTE